MASVRARDTRPELAVRRALWAAGLRYRVDYREAPGRPDIAFPGRRLAVFIDGDFWHGNAWRIRGLDRPEEMFPSRAKWWLAKIRRNVERDREVDRLLAQAGWRVLRFWESEVQRSSSRVARSIGLALRGKGRA